VAAQNASAIIACAAPIHGAAYLMTYATVRGIVTRPVVHDAIAIVVLAVACFGARKCVARAKAPFAVRAGLRAALAHSQSVCARWARVTALGLPIGAVAAVVDRPIAVVIDYAVARLDGI